MARQDKTFNYDSPYQYAMDGLQTMGGCTLAQCANPLAAYRAAFGLTLPAFRNTTKANIRAQIRAKAKRR